MRYLCLKELLTIDFSTSRSPIWDGPRKWNMSMLLRVGWALHKRLHPKRRDTEQSQDLQLALSHSPSANCMKNWHQPHIWMSSTQPEPAAKEQQHSTDSVINPIHVSMLICIVLLLTLSLCFYWGPLGPAWPFTNILFNWLSSPLNRRLGAQTS